jgi:peptidoglycan/xylan/chitin deacetylase (PgdA/CDA1 family)
VKPRVSVVIPWLEAGVSGRPTVEALAAAGGDVEVVVVDGGAVDEHTRRVWRALEKPVVHVIAAPGSGSAAARNAGVRASEAPLVVVLQPGDEPEPGLVSAAAARLEADSALGLVGLTSDEAGEPPAADLATLLAFPGRLAPAVLFRRGVWDASGGYDEALPGYEEHDLWLGALARGERAEVLARPRLRRAAATSALRRRSLDRDRHLSAMATLFRKHRAAFEARMEDVLCGREARYHAARQREQSMLQRRDQLRSELGELNREAESLAAALARAGRPRVEWGDLRRTTPVSPVWGYDRGQPVDRHYVERFLEAHAADIRGVVLEVQEADYTTRFGGARVVRSEVLDVNPANPRATVVADLRATEGVPADAYDCVIVTQTLHVIDDMRAAVASLFRMLKPGGVLLATLPCASRVCLEYGSDGDFWRVTEAGARRLFGEFFPASELEVRAYGNVMASAAFLYGLASHELSDEEKDAFDPYHPLLIGVRARKPLAVRPARPAPRAAGGRGAILLYHRVAAEEASDFHRLRVGPDDFRAHLELIRREYRPMPLLDMVRAARRGDLPDGAVAVTFDDGYLDNLTTASPLLLEQGIPAAFFVVTGALESGAEFWWDTLERVLAGPHALPAALEVPVRGQPLRLATATAGERRAAHASLHAALVTSPPAERDHAVRALLRWSGLPAAGGWRRPMNADEVRDLAARAGHTLGAHGVHHLALSAHAYEVQRQEVMESALRLERVLGRAVSCFAYPFGNYGREALEIVRAGGFEAALTCDEGTVTAGADPARLPRVEAPADVAALAARLRSCFGAAAEPTGRAGREPARAG